MLSMSVGPMSKIDSWSLSSLRKLHRTDGFTTNRGPGCQAIIDVSTEDKVLRLAIQATKSDRGEVCANGIGRKHQKAGLYPFGSQGKYHIGSGR